MIYSVVHTTDYRYDDYVSSCHNLANLHPRFHPGQELLDFKLEISPKPVELSERIDFFGNIQTRFSIQDSHNHLKVTARSLIKRNAQPLLENLESEACRSVTLAAARTYLKEINPKMLEAKQFVLESPFIKNIPESFYKYARVSFQENRSVFAACKELMTRIFNDFKFVSGFTTLTTPLSTVMEEKKGVCQDFAQIAIACLRSVGLPARYMSGYIETLPPEGQEKLFGVDASHAWFACYIPGFGWVEFDPTNDLVPAEQHLVTAWGRDYYDVPPLKGVIYTNGQNSMKVSVDIRPVESENLAVLKPTLTTQVQSQGQEQRQEQNQGYQTP